MAKKKVDIFFHVNTEKEFESALSQYRDKLICAEIFCSVFGSCVVLDRLFTKIKLVWSDDKVVLLKVLCDNIPALERFQGHSEPVYMFIVDQKTTKVFRGVDSRRFEAVARKELNNFLGLAQGLGSVQAAYELAQPTPDEMDWLNSRAAEKQQEISSLEGRRAARQAARKRHRAELMVPHLQYLNFVLYWPHAKHAHPELYERWDMNNIIMVGREEIVLTKEKALDVLYNGDAPLNEASLHKLMSGPALVICFRYLDADQHFVSLVRKILYEEIPPLDETKPMKDQPPQKTAFDLYKTFSPTRQEIWRNRREELLHRREEALHKRARRLSEMQRLARQAIEEAKQAKKAAKEQLKMELLKSGNLTALDQLREEPDEEQVDIGVPEELSDQYEEEISEPEDENEYFPAAGLLIPGLYAPLNDIAKVNGLALLFPKLVEEHVIPEPEFLPPHILVMLHMSKAHKAIQAMTKFKSAIIHMGVFKASTPYDAEHLAYSIHQYESLDLSINEDDLRLAFMVSIKKDLPVLELMDLNPLYVSRDPTAGEDDSAALFSVDYGDDYPEFEDFEEENND